jgi:hypothetical protein
MAYIDYDTPSEVFGAGYSSDGTSITFTIGAGNLLVDITAAEADPLTGDYRKVLYGIFNNLFGKYDAIPAASRPVEMALTRSTTEVNSVLTRNYSARFNLDGTFEVAPEPV